ncbi:MAG: HipA domain-containing protein [Treponema sp.]|jgi:serine/threonine-protein kinase HipA|nr:HipA domain-containing protein [Treponema sp.]
MNERKNIFVYLDMLDKPVLIGILHSDIVRGKELFSFTGGNDWLNYKEFRLLDPDLGPFEGQQYVRDGKLNFGLFLDSAPDRWGRQLILRREALNARREGRMPCALHESDFLLSVYDGSRMGALRLKLSPGGDFLDNNASQAVPPWISIRNLEYASLCLEQADSDGREYAKWLALLIAPGSSLGGARPKANVADSDGHLWIAKFPSGSDVKDVGAWEKVVNMLAANCGITVPESMSQVFSTKQHTFLTRRFDRIADSRRIHFASAMTLLGVQDGADYITGVSYLDIAGIIVRYGAEVERNLEELWRRMIFNIAVSNCDDHLRNHGFLLTPAGWVLSPAYDMNPDETGTGLKLAILENNNSLDFDLALEASSFFRLSLEKAKSILGEVRNAVAHWRSAAIVCGISREEQERLEPAFRQRQ